MKPIKTRKNRNIIKIPLAILLVIALIFILNFFKKEIRNYFYLVSNPTQKLFWQAGENASNFLASLIKTGELKSELNKLVSENNRLEAEISKLLELKNENKNLRQALGLEMSKDFKLILTDVIGKNISQDVILINKGSEDGIERNMSVISFQKTMVGRINEVYKNFSKVMLISDKKSSFDAKIQDKEIPGMIKGAGNLKIIFDLIPRDKEVSESDTVVTTSLGGIFPKGILVGRISSVKKNDVEPFQQVEIKPAFNLEEMSSLFVIIKVTNQ